MSRHETFEEIREWRRLQEKQPGDISRPGWEVVQSDFGDEKEGAGVIVFKIKHQVQVEIWDGWKKLRRFNPLYDLESYYQICDEKDWIPEAII